MLLRVAFKNMNRTQNKSAISSHVQQVRPQSTSAAGEKENIKKAKAKANRTDEAAAKKMDEKLKKESKVRDTLEDDVDIASYDSFPASDPPSSEMMT